jgi:NTP pyrophosphatase (non-canonical NTP hydrolase)
MTMSKTLNQLRDEAHRIAVEHGFKDASVGEDLMLMVTELAEAMEAFRENAPLAEMTYEPNGKPMGVPSEIADVIIRALHFCGKHGIDIEKAVEVKMAYNATRPFKHGGKRL